MLGVKSWSWYRRSLRSKLLMVMSPTGLSKATRRSHVVVEKGARHTNNCTVLFWNVPPIPVPELSVAPNKEGKKGLISQR